MKLEVHKKEVTEGFIYYYVICPKCKKEIRAHKEHQVKFNFGLHEVVCVGE